MFFKSLSFIDRKKPEFKSLCPSDKSVITEKGKTDRIVYWSAITAEDNDGEVPEMEVTVTPINTPMNTPVEILPTATSHKFSEGTYDVTFTARDKSRNSQSCSFRVEVKGITSHFFVCGHLNKQQQLSLNFSILLTHTGKEGKQ